MGNSVNPDHYKQYRVEVIDLTRDMPFLTGNVVKYVCRAPYKGNEVLDLLKAKQYLEWAIEDARTREASSMAKGTVLYIQEVS